MFSAFLALESDNFMLPIFKETSKRNKSIFEISDLKRQQARTYLSSQGYQFGRNWSSQGYKFLEQISLANGTSFEYAGGTPLLKIWPRTSPRRSNWNCILSIQQINSE